MAVQVSKTFIKSIKKTPYNTYYLSCFEFYSTINPIKSILSILKNIRSFAFKGIPDKTKATYPAVYEQRYIQADEILIK